MDPISQGVAGNAIWTAITTMARTVFSSKIKITSPRPQETLSDAQPLGSNYKFPVRGALKRLPKGHEIWILVQDDATGFVRPQGFSQVQFDPHLGTWTGWINGSGKADIRIVAVVAPPTSQDYFRYFQKLGVLRDYEFEPLMRVPFECINLDSVQARIPAGLATAT
jgi:hypothetical protein